MFDVDEYKLGNFIGVYKGKPLYRDDPESIKILDSIIEEYTSDKIKPESGLRSLVESTLKELSNER